MTSTTPARPCPGSPTPRRRSCPRRRWRWPRRRRRLPAPSTPVAPSAAMPTPPCETPCTPIPLSELPCTPTVVPRPATPVVPPVASTPVIAPELTTPVPAIWPESSGPPDALARTPVQIPFAVTASPAATIAPNRLPWAWIAVRPHANRPSDQIRSPSAMDGPRAGRAVAPAAADDARCRPGGPSARRRARTSNAPLGSAEMPGGVAEPDVAHVRVADEDWISNAHALPPKVGAGDATRCRPRMPVRARAGGRLADFDS